MPVGWPPRNGASAAGPERMLIVTNGTAAVGALDDAGIPGERLAWEDVLHDGPIPEALDLEALSRVRARFIADRGWGAFDEVLARFRVRDARLRRAHDDDEVVLWFEHDLYDQLQLIQVLDWLAAPARRPARLSLICHARFVGKSTAPELQRDFDTRTPVLVAQIGLAADAWAAVCAPTPEFTVALLNRDTGVLPFLRGALLRFLEELPARDGLARSERQLLRAVAEGAATVGDAFWRAQQLENPTYLGDASFQCYAERLMQGPAPLLRADGGVLSLTDVGRAVLAEREDRIRINGIHRWWGGVRLTTESLWRWDAERQMLRPPKRQVE